MYGQSDNTYSTVSLPAGVGAMGGLCGARIFYGSHGTNQFGYPIPLQLREAY